MIKEPTGSEIVSHFDWSISLCWFFRWISTSCCNRIPAAKPKQIVILDLCENGACDVQQELRIACGGKLNLQIEICSITNPQTMELTLHGNCSTGRDCTGMQPRLGKRINVRRLWICGF